MNSPLGKRKNFTFSKYFTALSQTKQRLCIKYTAALCNAILLLFTEEVQKVMGENIVTTGYKMPFFGNLVYMQTLVELLHILHHFTLYPQLCGAAESRAPDFAKSFNYLRNGIIEATDKALFNSRLKHLKQNKVMSFSTGIKEFLQSPNVIFRRSDVPSPMPYFLMEAMLESMRHIRKHEIVNILRKGTLCHNKINNNLPLTSFAFQ